MRLGDPDAREQVTFLAPVDLDLRADDLEPAVRPLQRVVIGVKQLVLDPRPDCGQVHHHPLVVDFEAVISEQAFVDDATFQGQVASQPRLDQRGEGCDHLRLRASSARRPRRGYISVHLELLLDRAGVDPALTGDLGVAGTSLVHHVETAEVQPIRRR